MPVHQGRDSINGSYYQYGTSGKKYYYKEGNEEARQIAYNLSVRQSSAIHASQNRRGQRN